MIYTIKHDQHTPEEYAAIVELCSRAYECDFAPFRPPRQRSQMRR